MATTRDSVRDIDDRTEDLKELAAEHPDLWRDFLTRFEMSWIYHENALEGIVLTHAEITSALKGRPIATDTYPAIRNFRMAIDTTRSIAPEGAPIDHDLVLRFHAIFGSHDPKYQVGRYRKDIPLHRTYFHDIAPPEDIDPRLKTLLAWAAENDPVDDDDAPRFAAQFHHEFMSIFPYSENCGKTGRLLINYVLLRHGYLPVVFHATDRQRYFDTLRLSKKEMEAYLNETMANCLENGTKYIEKILEERAKKSVRRLAVAS